jgi:hypothetical protein
MKLVLACLVGAALGANINLKTTSGVSTKIEWDGTVLTVPQREQGSPRRARPTRAELTHHTLSSALCPRLPHRDVPELDRWVGFARQRAHIAHAPGP